MNSLLMELTKKACEAFKKCGYAHDLGLVRTSDRPDLCAFQCNGAFPAAKKYRKAPSVIAGEVAKVLKEDKDFSSVSVKGAGFINLDVTDEFLLKFLCEMVNDPNTGVPQAENEETIFIDYGGPNAAKPLHVGHVRSAVIGESLKRIVKATGRRTVGDVHLGDWGLQMGMVMKELEDRGKLTEQIELSQGEWDTLYSDANAKKKLDPEFDKAAHEITYKFQNGDPKYLSAWKQIMAISLKGIRQMYDILGAQFDLWHGESDAAKYVGELMDALEKRNMLIDSMGAKVVDVSREDDTAPIPPVIIKKTDGSDIYATTDLAAIIEREKLFQPDEIWYVVDNRQALHFKQVFRCAKMAGLVENEEKLMHLGFGTINGPDGKPLKSRDGNVLKLSDFYEDVYSSVLARAAEGEDREENAHKIAVAAIKFGDLINFRAKDYIFDLEKFTSYEGKTGSFILYTISRINSVFRKAGEIELYAPEEIYTDSELNLIYALLSTGDKFLSAYEDKAPNVIAESAFEIAGAFSSFYAENKVLSEADEEKKNAWLYLMHATKVVLLKHLDALGIEAVERM